ncbi:MAG: hypothetical protein IKL55_04510 [Clostridia bacterium]|nr:hypothetical protein [Clostridia bacterium]
MKKIITTIFLILLLLINVILLSGCTLTVETTENSVTASVDGETTEKVDGILDWVKDRISRVFNVDVKTNVDKNSVKITTGTSEKI